jgi:hypothetical protein
MATSILPGLTQGSSRVPQDRFIEDQAETGRFRVRRVSRRQHWQFQLRWQNRLRADWASVEAFWRATRERQFEYVWPLDGEVYLAHFLQAPQSRPVPGGLWDIEVTLSGRPKIQ